MRLFPIEGPAVADLAALAADLGLPASPEWHAVTLEPDLTDVEPDGILAARLGPTCWRPVDRAHAQVLADLGHLIARVELASPMITDVIGGR